MKKICKTSEIEKKLPNKLIANEKIFKTYVGKDFIYILNM